MARLTKPLTNTEVERAKAKDKEYTLSDGGGLYLLVKSNGGKLWRFNYYKPITKKRALISFGRYPDVSLQQARKQRDECLALLSESVDPLEHRQQQEAEALAERENTFSKIALKWRDKCESRVKNGELQALTLKKNWRIIEKYLFPRLADCPIANVTPKLVIQALEPAKEKGVSDTLKRAIRLLNDVLNFAVNADVIEFNKCLNVGENFSVAKSQNNPTIHPKELPHFLMALRDYNLSFQTKQLIKWQLLTMTRSREASGTLWAEIDFEAKTWTIPAEKMKMKRPHIIPLSRQAVEILEKMRKITGNSPFVFQSETKPKQPMNSQTANRAIGLLGYKGILTAHGMRSIASTYLNEQLVNYDVVEACLAHVIKDQTRKAYNRSDYLDQRVEVMQQWADYVESCSMGI
ncbi:integrase arm-type DNA-binding domain-containing protein [Actinobacillus minor]|uniref:integrase arm-type DNA-binding domain-containing protein n=1 Tax=Actinobacillus minor TaxID=51047 RepID=UPI0023F47833|nr:integrase arm-type DNA-binding domain-containing protein [Actinobacillus minor]MDD6910419.1 tyrosine-type recombinase/integrase [Actinobacillus minor]MDY4714098.1 tyrosine-type recombinase/integrase [Actinobacillus minor]